MRTLGCILFLVGFFMQFQSDVNFIQTLWRFLLLFGITIIVFTNELSGTPAFRIVDPLFYKYVIYLKKTFLYTRWIKFYQKASSYFEDPYK